MLLIKSKRYANAIFKRAGISLFQIFERSGRYIALAFILFTASLSYGAAEQQPWYNIELIVFKRLSINQTELPADVERLTLSYPKSILTFATPELPTSPETTDGTIHDGSDTLPSAGLTETPAGDLIAGTFLTPQPTSEHQLSDKARALRLSRNQRVLFHQSWNQLLTGAKEAPAIFINGGEQFGKHQELEGYVKLSLSRYLHLNTNLWLSSFISNEGQEIGNWTKLPAQPLTQHRVPEQEATYDGYALSTNTNEVQNFDSVTPYLTQQESSGFHIQSIDNLLQKRRMRSGELHYIDHPAFGVLLKITPIESPQWPYNNQPKPAKKVIETPAAEPGLDIELAPETLPTDDLNAEVKPAKR